MPAEQRNVSFNPRTKVRLIGKRRAARALWYSDEDMQSIKEEIEETIECYIYEIPTSPLGLCIRGLESYTIEPPVEKQRRKLVHTLTVILEQDRQSREHNSTIDKNGNIARYLQSTSRNNAQRAHQRGLLDERAARKIYHENVEAVQQEMEEDNTHANGKQNLAATCSRNNSPKSVTSLKNHRTPLVACNITFDKL